MEIHELNTYAGSLDSNAYIAIDNSADTAKIPYTELMKPVTDRLTADETQISAIQTEVTGARTGADGTQYDSLGNAIRGQVSDLKSNLNNALDVSTLGWEIGSLNSGSGTEQTSDTRIRSDYIPVSEGTKVNLSGNEYCLVVYCFDNNKAWISDTTWSSINNAFTVPSGVSYIRILIRVSSSNPTISSEDVVAQYSRCSVSLKMPQRIYTLPNEVDLLDTEVDNLADLTTAEVEEITQPTLVWTGGGYIDANGNVQSNSGYSYSNLIPVSFGDIVTSPHMRFVTAYKTETSTSYNDFKTNVTEYTVSSVTKFIRISKANAYINEPVYVYHKEKRNIALLEIDGLNTTRNGAKGQIKAESPFSNSTIEFNALAGIRKGKTYTFYGKITSLNKLTIGCGTTTVNASRIEIDATNVTFINANTVINTTAHNLTFATYIYVIVDIDENSYPTVTIYTDGGNFKKTYADEWIGSASRTYATADADTSLTDCELTFSAKDIKKNIWYCGDSYMAVRDSGKIPSKLKYFDVFKNINSIGYSGAGSENVIPYILNLFGENLYPKYLIWALGMNNGDTSSAVNATWKSGYDMLVELAESNLFELVLATIPNTPTVNNNYKNAIVRASGYRYIDFASAVQTAEGESTWLPGMLSSDNVHPTSEGAKALASKLCADFPEIFN